MVCGIVYVVMIEYKCSTVMCDEYGSMFHTAKYQWSM
jgi:hypothetical protein